MFGYNLYFLKPKKQFCVYLQFTHIHVSAKKLKCLIITIFIFGVCVWETNVEYEIITIIYPSTQLIINTLVDGYIIVITVY